MHFCLKEKLKICVFWRLVFQNDVFAPSKDEDLFFSEIYFSKVSILPSFEISITGLKTVRRLQPPVPVLLPPCRQTYLSFALVHNLYLLVQILLQDCLDTIAQ